MARRLAKSAEDPARAIDLPLGELVCLGLVDQGVDHGWAIGSLLAVDGELGRIWSLSRPLTYRAIDQLDHKGLLRREGHQGQGRERTTLSLTPDGQRTVRAWLDQPVGHVRDVRTELLLKLVLRRRQGLTLEPLLQAQQRQFERHFDALTIAGPASDPVDLWRRESARAVRRFLDAALAQLTGALPLETRPSLRLSARNQLHGRVAAVIHGDTLSTVKTVLPGGQVVTAVITRESALDLDIAPDDDIIVAVKSTEVMLAKP